MRITLHDILRDSNAVNSGDHVQALKDACQLWQQLTDPMRWTLLSGGLAG